MSELPPGWEWARLGDLGDEVRGSVRPELGETYELYSVPCFPSGKPEFLSGEEIGSSKRPVQPGDVLLCKINPRINRVWIVAEPAGAGPQIASTEYLVLRTRTPALAEYLRIYLQSSTFRTWIELSVEGATGSHTRAKSGPILEQLAPLPPEAEQGRIVEAWEQCLSRLEAAEDLLAVAEKRLGLFLRAAIRTAFESSNWPWTTLGEIAEVRGGVTKDSKRQSDATFVDVPYLRVANVQRGWLDLSEVTTIRVHPDKAAALRLEHGDVLLNEGGDRDKLGRGWVWEGQIDGCIHQNHVFRARLSGDFDPYFVSTHANTWGQAWFEEHGRQTTNLASINLGTLRQLPVPAPPLEEQRAIVAQIRRANEAHQRLLDSISQAKARAAALRRSILAAAFSGQLVPQDPDDEPASVLLERIRAERQTTSASKRRTRS